MAEQQPPALADKINQAAEATALARRGQNTVLGIFQDERVKRLLTSAIPAGAGLTPERLLSVAFGACRENDQLLECTRESFISAMLEAARLGLEIGGSLGHFHLVPFRNKGVLEVVPILGYRGIIVLARRSGELASIAARPVYSADYFDWAYGLEDKLVHRPQLSGDRGHVVAFYGIARMVNGGVQPLVMSKAEVDTYRKRSRAADSSFSPWNSDYDAMGAKTVIRRMEPFLPLTVEAATAIQRDEAIEEGRAAALAELVLPEPAAQQRATTPDTAPKARPRRAAQPESSGAQGAPAQPAQQGETADTSGPPAQVAGTPAPDTASATQAAGSARYVCPICGAEEDLTGHTTHDDARHAAWAKEQRERKQQEGTDGEPQQ